MPIREGGGISGARGRDLTRSLYACNYVSIQLTAETSSIWGVISCKFFILPNLLLHLLQNIFSHFPLAGKHRGLQQVGVIQRTVISAQVL